MKLIYDLKENKGWTCPVCHRVYAPMMTECSNCNKQVSTGVSSNEASCTTTISTWVPEHPVTKEVKLKEEK